jgi:asparagine synthase (glutamine-hydrolysing)
MCGIAGLAGNFHRTEGQHAVELMVAAVANRGPDGAGVESWPRAILGHRRLAIFDLSELGHQPMLSPDRTRGVVFNGAIYNFKTLRSELEKAGYQFKSQTDTEVLLHGFDAWGIDRLVARLRGMFAFALWDDRTDKLFLVRDRLGVKPLVYAVKDGTIAFASTITAIKAAGFLGDIDQSSIAEYLEFGYVTDGRVIYSDGHKVPAAAIVEWSEGSITTREYWQPPEVSSPTQPLSFMRAVDETEQLFLQAVEKRLQADVPVGALLSGGVDSSLVCWAISKLGADITAFTVATPGDPWDESADAKLTAERLRIKHKVLNLSSDDTPEISDLIAAYDEPFACASALGMLSVSRAVRREATVLLTGDGGDDVFLGYPEHRNFWLAQKLACNTPRVASDLWLHLRNRMPRRSVLKRAGSLFDYMAGGLGAIACAHDGLPVYRRLNMLGERLSNVEVDQRQIAWSRESARHLMQDFLRYDRQTRFVGEYMKKVDGATMFHALEARAPFLDQDLWEFAARLPFETRLHQNRLKAILRELARRHLGDRVADGRKRGFGIPVQRWLVGRWRELMSNLMSDSVLQAEGWIRADSVLQELKNATNKNWAPNQLWYVLVLELWFRRQQRELKTFTSSERARDYSTQLAAI